MRIPVLDHGYVEFVEAWGGGKAWQPEAGIIEAARQSTQGSFRGWEQDAKLLGFLYKNKPQHATPFEFAGMVLEVQAPIFVFREWHRHRTQCLSGDSVVFLVSPNGTGYRRRIRDIFDLRNGRLAGTGPHCTRNGYSKNGVALTRRARWKDPQHVGALPNCQNRTLRVIDEATGVALSLPMADVWSSGVKEIFEVETASGLSVKCSAAHPFLTREGWAKLGDISNGIETARYAKVPLHQRPIPPALRQGIGVWTSMMRRRLIRDMDACYVCGHVFAFDDLALDHVEPVYANLKLALDEENLRPICGSCHRLKTNGEQTGAVTRMGVKWDRVVRIERVGEEQTYDLEVDGPHHNFVANGFVVHNSYNEMSARYSPLPDLNYQPSVERCMAANSATTNKQAQSVTGRLLARADAERWTADLAELYRSVQAHYQLGLDIGLPKEVARCSMTVARYSRMRAQATLRNWLAFLTLRMDPNAQLEIRQYANAVGELVSHHFPQTWRLFTEASQT